LQREHFFGRSTPAAGGEGETALPTGCSPLPGRSIEAIGAVRSFSVIAG
jgi:hypothetical protein